MLLFLLLTLVSPRGGTGGRWTDPCPGPQQLSQGQWLLSLHCPCSRAGGCTRGLAGQHRTSPSRLSRSGCDQRPEARGPGRGGQGEPAAACAPPPPDWCGRSDPGNARSFINVAHGAVPSQELWQEPHVSHPRGAQLMPGGAAVPGARARELWQARRGDGYPHAPCPGWCLLGCTSLSWLAGRRRTGWSHSTDNTARMCKKTTALIKLTPPTPR